MKEADSDGGSAVDYVIDGSVAIARLNRPEVRNAIDDTMREHLVEVLGRANDDDAIRSFVLTGSGTAFCAGGDVASMQERLATSPGLVAGRGWRRQRETHKMVVGLHNMLKVSLAAVNGPAIGVGMDLALACDFIVASEGAIFSMGHLARGLIPDGGGMYFLPRRIGLARAKELIFTARRLSAQEACNMGIIDRVVPESELLAATITWARELSGHSTTATALTKSILNRSYELSLSEVFALGAEAQAVCYTTDEHRESVEKFLRRSGRTEA